ncbi:MAG TPA: hypothetical protein VHL11_08285, partial [Phototrophicaceae bacterium]|nr:hypothetical protein [Phototrophicaceae bacterium]
AHLYTEADGSINQVRFIENGARILAEVQSSDNQTHLKVLNRDGSVAGEIVGSLRDLTGTPDGFVGMFDNSGAPAIAYINTTASTLTPTTLWSGTPNTTYTLVRVTSG